MDEKLNRLSYFAELYKMVCDPGETDLDIHIPAVMLPQDAGASLEKIITNSSSGELLCIYFHGYRANCRKIK